jgi:hypothetical protein
MARLRSRIILALALIALPASATPGRAQASDGLAGPVSYEVRSWGRILLRWQVNPDGSGEIWRGPRQMKGPQAIEKYRLHLQGDALRTFVTNMEDVREATKGGIPCAKEVFDLPYGSVTWDYPGAKQVYSFDAGCRSEEGDDAMEILAAASTIIENMAAIEPKPYMTEPLPPR